MTCMDDLGLRFLDKSVSEGFSRQLSNTSVRGQWAGWALPTNLKIGISVNGGRCPPYKNSVIATGARCDYMKTPYRSQINKELKISKLR